MASGHPKFGGTNDVTALDIGQNGGTRAGAAQAIWVGRSEKHPAEVAHTLHSIPGQNVVFKSVQGFTGQRVMWIGTIKTDTEPRWDTIHDEIEAYRHGGLTTPDPDQLKATQLTNSAGVELSTRAVMIGWRMTDRLHALSDGGGFTRLAQVEIEFAILR